MKAMATRHRSSARAQRAPVLLAGLLLVLLLAIGVAVGLFALQWMRGSLATPGIAPGLPGSTQPSENVTYGFGQLLPTWGGRERLTVLVLGVDEREQESGPWRTDTIMLLTVDPAALQAGALSIPRDLWVPIPGHRDGRINTAHFLGDLYNHPRGGPGLAVETVEYNLGIPVNYYVRVNFQAFVSLVDQIGGIDVYVEQAINDPLYPDHAYGYDPLYIEAGWHHFNGEMALKYARTRHGSSDFDRARRQQQVMMAMLERVTAYELLPQLARTAPQIYETIQASVTTDLALDQILALANVAVSVPKEEIRLGVIDQTCTQPWVTPDGAQVLVPLRDRMREVRDYVFTTVPAVVEEVAAPTLVVPTPTPEVATLAVLNGTTRGGLAGTVADYLRAEGFDVARVANADRQDHAATQVLQNRDRPMTLARVLETLGLPRAVVQQGQPSDGAQDIVIVLGQDFQAPAP